MKAATSVPDLVFDAAERLSKRCHVPCNKLFSGALDGYVSRHGTEAITDQLDEVYASEHSAMDSTLAQAQIASIAHDVW